MLLAIDSGNTTTQFVVFNDDTIVADWRTQCDVRRTPDDYRVWLGSLMQLEGFSPEAITGCIIASVVPRVQTQLVALCQRYFHEPVVIDHITDYGLKAKVPDPQQVGADRLVNGVAVKAAGMLPAVVVDFGTATSFDLFDGHGDFLGGVLAPGIRLSVEALSRGAARLPAFGVQRPASIIAQETIPALQSGTWWGYVSMVEGLLARIHNQHTGIRHVIATGGYARTLAADITGIDTVDMNLTITGLRLLYARTSS